MSYIMPFMPVSQGFIIATSGTPSTSQSTLVTTTSVGLQTPNQPMQIRLLNLPSQTVAIWLSMTAATGAVTIPTAGTTTTGTPSNGTWAWPGIEISLTLPCGWAIQQSVNPAVPGFWINTIASVASQQLLVTLGEGV